MIAPGRRIQCRWAVKRSSIRGLRSMHLSYPSGPKISFQLKRDISFTRRRRTERNLTSTQPKLALEPGNWDSGAWSFACSAYLITEASTSIEFERDRLRTSSQFLGRLVISEFHEPPPVPPLLSPVRIRRHRSKLSFGDCPASSEMRLLACSDKIGAPSGGHNVHAYTSAVFT